MKNSDKQQSKVDKLLNEFSIDLQNFINSESDNLQIDEEELKILIVNQLNST